MVNIDLMNQFMLSTFSGTSQNIYLFLIFYCALLFKDQFIDLHKTILVEEQPKIKQI